MFKTKYTVSILNSKWEPIEIKLKLQVIPRMDEYIYLNGQYYQVLNVIHQLKNKHEIFVVINEAFIAPLKK
jgi:hypothetical protein